MLQLVLNSFLRPREVIAVVLRYPIGERELVIAAGLISTLLSLCIGVMTMMNAGDDPLQLQRFNPIPEAIINFVLILATALLVMRIGRAFGGQGTRLDSLKAVVWFNWVTALPTLVIFVLMLMDQNLAWFLRFVLVGVLIVVFSVFVQVLHGFDSLLKTLLGILVSAFLFGFVLLSAFVMLGFVPTV